MGGVRKWQEIWAPKSLAGLNLPSLKGSVFPPKGVCPSVSEMWPLLYCSHLVSQTSPSFWQQCSGNCWNHLEPKLCPLLQKLPGKHPDKCVGSDVSCGRKIGNVPHSCSQLGAPIPKPLQPSGQLEPHAAGNWLLSQHQITHENMCVSLIGFGKVC